MRSLIIIALLFLSGCGFTPLYGTNNNNLSSSQLSQIKVQTPTGRMGQQLNNALAENFYTTTAQPNQKYGLAVTINEESSKFGFKVDQSTTRESYSITASYTLTELSSGEVLTSGNTVARTAYDVVQSDFANVQARQDAKARIVDETAQAITIKLATYFNNNEN